ncbi:MAG: hypothetical protein LKF96_03175 [Treponema sp.]|jgi:hypothetical protein|nr:hypothetical protein [Treponema sp.]
MELKSKTIEQGQRTAPEHVSGTIIRRDGETWYVLRNVNAIPPFFMTMTSSSDIWNFIWSDGSLSAGRKDCDHAIFPYYTADKIYDMGSCTGSYTALKIPAPDSSCTYLWEPFARETSWKTVRTLYKNSLGSRIIFEEDNKDLSLIFSVEWTSSEKYGLIRCSRIMTTGSTAVRMQILDGSRNILPACTTSDFQNNNSVLLDAYKKTDLDVQTGLTMFSLSSVITDKAEPSEALFANTAWFSCDAPVYLDPETPSFFAENKKIQTGTVLKGKRASCYTIQDITVKPNAAGKKWYQVFDTSLEISAVRRLQHELGDREKLTAELERDIVQGGKLLESYVAAADGLQHTADDLICMHHKANVLFNIMRGGTFVENNTIHMDDFLTFTETKNRFLAKKIKNLQSVKTSGRTVTYTRLELIFREADDLHLYRLYLEYLPLSFSRRHGDPSRPWNRFSIRIKDAQKNNILNYEGNWRDIFQNWEALAMSYPVYTTSMIALFLNAVTADGYNPYRISKSGIDWEIPDPFNSWSNIGYWNDHQIIYLCKLLELQDRLDGTILSDMLDTSLFTTADVPYRIKGWDALLENPRDTIFFDKDLDSRIRNQIAVTGTDAKLVCTAENIPVLVSLTAKLLQLILTKLANFVSGGGIWMNTQRPEWNDANNALAGWGLSIVTLCYVRRMTVFMKKLYTETKKNDYTVPACVAGLFETIAELYTHNKPAVLQDPGTRMIFSEQCGRAFENERTALYADPAEALSTTAAISRKAVLSALDSFMIHIDYTLNLNKRKDGLYHSYNTLVITGNGMEINHLQEMLEGQVAVLSSGKLSSKEAAELYDVIKNSRLHEERNHSYMLYPDKELPFFTSKNNVDREDAVKIPILAGELSENRTLPAEQTIIYTDSEDAAICHFNPAFRNSAVLSAALKRKYENCSRNENQRILALYEKTFNHKNFTGRSGTFYAYEGLGSIYWHMVAKLLLAIQEAYMSTPDTTADKEVQHELAMAYYDIRSGIGFNKNPELYGAVPTDPYSHTPSGQGAKQPGMTGQVKEEIITRWGELGTIIQNGILRIRPSLLRRKEFDAGGQLEFTRFGTKFVYLLGRSETMKIQINDGRPETAEALTQQDSRELFCRTGTIKKVTVSIPASAVLA